MEPVAAGTSCADSPPQTCGTMWANGTSGDLQCSDTTAGRYALTIICFSYALVSVPLSTSVLCVGFQQRSASSSAAMSHSDFFTYNMAVVELLTVVGFVLTYCSSYTLLPALSLAGVVIVSFTWPGQTLFPVLICVERYLAVVHPITYRALRRAGGFMIRSISTGLIWFGCFMWLLALIVLNIASYYRRVLATFVLIVSLIVMTFCNLSVLRILIRPHPGAAGSSRAQANQPKQRATLIVLLIMTVLWFKFGGNVMVIISRFSPLLSVKCVGEASTFVFFLPSAVVLPLLLLHRVGKLPRSRQSGSA